MDDDDLLDYDDVLGPEDDDVDDGGGGDDDDYPDDFTTGQKSVVLEATETTEQADAAPHAADEPAGAVDEPVEAIDEPARAVDEAVEAVDEPAEPANDCLRTAVRERDALARELAALRSRDTDRRVALRARRELSVSQLHDELYEASSKLVVEGEKNAALARKLTTLKTAHDALRQDAERAKKLVVDKIALRAGKFDLTEKAYAHVTLSQLVGLREKALELTTADRVARPASAVPHRDEAPRPATTDDRAKAKRKPTVVERQRSKTAPTPDADVVQSLKAKLADAHQRSKAEKDARVRAQDDTKLANKKVAALSDHVEKLMAHLKHEVAAKVAAQDQLRRVDKDLELARHKIAHLIKRNNVREKCLLELKEGSKILEDQLRLMDQRFLDLRAKLDWTRAFWSPVLPYARSQVTMLTARSRKPRPRPARSAPSGP